MYSLIAEVLDSGRISYGPMSLEFERKFAAAHDCAYAILSNSGTSALQVALQALKEIHHWNDGDQVIVPATTFVATADIVLHNRLVPVFVDVDPTIYNINVDLIEAAITDRTRAIIPVHLFGQSANMLRVMEIANAHRMKVIEDSCETMFVKHNGMKVGSMGDVGCFSTYVAHLLVTGVGGLCTTSNPDYAARIRSLVNHGMALEHLNPGENFSPRPNPGRRFAFDSVGHSFRITELEAALGLAQLEDIDNALRLRARNARQYTSGLKIINEHYGNSYQTPAIAEGNEHAWMMYPIVLRDGSKEPLMTYLNERGIETRDMLPLINQPTYHRRLRPQDYPVSQWLITSGFYVGCHQDLEPDDITYTLTALEDWAHDAYLARESSGHTHSVHTEQLAQLPVPSGD